MTKSQETGLSIMGRPVHPTVAEQIRRSWDETIPRLRKREEILSEQKYSNKELALLITGLHLGIPLTLIDEWSKQILQTKTNPDLVDSLDSLTNEYSNLLYLWFPHHFSDKILDDFVDSDA